MRPADNFADASERVMPIWSKAARRTRQLPVMNRSQSDHAGRVCTYSNAPNRMMNRTFLILACLVSSFQLLAQTSSQRAAVLLSATVQSNPPSITLNWTSVSNTSSISIYRKLKTSSSWGSSIANPSSSSTSYQDYGVSIGTAYEYKVVRVSNGVTGTGYIASGIEVQPVDYRGKMILLVDNTLAPNMVNELNQLENDLKADGWAVLRSDVSRTASASSIKSIIQGHYNSDPQNVKALYLIGHVPVPYSGNQAPDGHSEHVGAWPCDGYYGELTGSWTDNSVNNNGAQRSANRNIPGDGKFDQSSFPSDLELQVGRVDMYDMTAFSSSEGQLLRNYLNRAHSFKIKGWSPQNRALMFDNLQWVANPLAGSGWRNMGPLVGASNITNANQNGTQFQSLVNGESYLWTYSSGGGSQLYESGQITFNGANNVGTTQNYASNSSMGGVFNMSCGSYFGDWDNKNNFLRAPIAKGDALTSVWSGIPAWYFHHMGQGENIGYSVMLTMNNSSLYTPITEGWQGSIGKVHLGLMGDPSLRMQMIAPPTNLSVTNNGGTAAFAWSASPESGLAGYHIYRFSSTGAITRLTSNPVSGTSYSNGSIPFEAGKQYMVRAVKLTVNNSGSYYNLSLGSIATAAGTSTSTPDCQGVSNGPAMPGTPCNDNDPCTINDTWNSNCQCAGTPANVSASITPAGATTFCVGGSVQLNANTGSGLTYQWRKDGVSISGATSNNYTATESGTYTVRVYSGSCQATSAGITVSTTTAPTASITAAGGTTFCAGGSVQLNANTGSGLTYQWRKDGVSISGATSNNYTATEAGTYTVRVYSGSCYNTSSGITVSTTTAPSASITAAGGTTFCAGGSVQLNANTGSGLTYQWRKDGVSISGATSNNYTATESGTYTVRVYSGSCYNTSSGITVNTTTAPAASITASGATTFCAGGSVQLNANTGSGLNYQWRKDGVSISGATSNNYTATEAGTYTVRVYSGSCYNTSSGITVNTTTAPAASITAAGATTFCAGGSVQLNANTGSGLTYNWRKDGVTISGATASSYVASSNGVYTVRVTSNGCQTTSSGITVSIQPLPTATIVASGSTNFCSGGSVVLTAPSGSGLSYVWRRDGNVIQGATSNTMNATVSGSYTVQISNGSCSNTSAPQAINVSNGPVATITPQGPTDLCEGEVVILQATTGNGLSYTWSFNGSSIAGANSSTFSASEEGSYNVTISNGSCSATSTAMNVNVGSMPQPEIVLEGATGFCDGGSISLTTDSDPHYTYQWTFNGIPLTNANSNSLIADAEGSYAVAVQNGGCVAVSEIVDVEAYSAPEISCFSDSTTGTVGVTVSGDGNYTFLWNSDPTLDSAVVEADLSGVNTVVVTDQNGCSSSCTVEIDPPFDGAPCVGLRTHTQNSWEAQPILAQFDNAFPDDLTIGCGFRTMVLTSAEAVAEFLPSNGPSQRLPFGNMIDPGQGYDNTLAGELVALKLAVRFDELDSAFSSSDMLLKDAVIATGTFEGMTVAELIEEADKKIGGCFSVHNRIQLRNALAQINVGYANGVMASGYLMCPVVEEPATMPGTPVATESREKPELVSANTTAYPNPFINMTTISIAEIRESGKMTVDILSADGLEIEQLFNGVVTVGEEKKITWDASSRAKGVYMYRVIINDRVMMGRLVLQ